MVTDILLKFSNKFSKVELKPEVDLSKLTSDAKE